MICKRYCDCDTKECFNEIFVDKQYVIGILVIKRDVARLFVNADQMKKAFKARFRVFKPNFKNLKLSQWKSAY
jgi:hypothetical protein